MNRNELTGGKLALISVAIGVGLIVFEVTLLTDHTKDLSFNPIFVILLFLYCVLISVVYCPIGFGIALGLQALRFAAYEGTQEQWTENEFFCRAAFWPVTLPVIAPWYILVFVVNNLAEAHNGINEWATGARQRFYGEPNNESDFESTYTIR